MKRFRFDLESVRDVRKETERRSAQALAQARRALVDAGRTRLELEASQQEVRRRIAEFRARGTSVGQLQNLQFVQERLERRIADAADLERKARELLDSRIAEYRDAARDREILDRLRERRLDDWRVELNRTEQKTLDEAGLRGHADRADRPGRES